MTDVAFQTFIDEMVHAESEMDLSVAAARFSESFGFSSFAYLKLGPKGVDLLSTYPAVWTEHYIGNRFEQFDPVVTASWTSKTPFAWGLTGDIRPADSNAKKLFSDAAVFGIKYGITVPIRGSRKQIAAFTVSTNDRAAVSRFSLERAKISLELAALQFHAFASTRLPRFMSNKQYSSLTRRQRACLSFASAGKSAKEVARIVGLKPRTVEHHIEEAKRRLGAHTLGHAIAKAVRERLIE
jgi:LuxR family transcriptional regulator, activator of conjugal transfer of Ti plasmids